MASIIKSFAQVTDNNFEKKVLKNSLPVIVIFERSIWGAAHIMGPILKKIISTYAGKIEIYRYNMDKNFSISRFYRVQAGIAILVFNNSSVVNKTGVISFTKLQEIIEPLINGYVIH